MNTFTSSIFSVALGVMLSSCGGRNTGSSAACTPITACGGDIVGTWHIQKTCLPTLTPEVPTNCPTAKLNVTSLVGTGTLTFGADGTTQNVLSGTFSETADFPTSCFDQAQCTQEATALGAGPGVTSASCTFDATSGCSCSLTDTTSNTANGTYSVGGTNVTLVTPGQPDETDSYCVSGSTFSMQSTGADGQITTIVATR